MTDQRDTCGCTPAPPTPPRAPNAPGRDRLDYRVARQPVSLARMLDRLPGPASAEPLRRLTTREADDPAIGLLDAAAVTADILAFYSERIANEGFLRTARERRSILELAAEIGYQLRPGLAAEAWLAFGLEDRAATPGQALEAAIPAGTRVQSVPARGGAPQTFETIEPFVARAAWNELHPVLSAPQDLDEDAETIYLAGTATGVAEGDVLLLAVAGPTGAVGRTPRARVAHRVVAEGDLGRTRVELAPAAQPARVHQRQALPAGTVHPGFGLLTGAAAQATIGQQSWSEQGMGVLLQASAWDDAVLEAYFTPRPAAQPDLGPAAPGVFAFRSRAAVFGHNAPLHALLPTSVTSPEDSPIHDDWDAAATGVTVLTDSQGSAVGTGQSVRLDATYRVPPGGWVVLAAGSPDTGKAYRVATAADVSLADFALSAKVTELELKGPDGGTPAGLSAFRPRTTSVFAGSVRLDLAEVPLPAELPAGERALDLDRLVLGLAPGQAVALAGERADLPGVRGTEVVALASVEHAGGRTRLSFSPTEHPYLRRTVTLSANVVRASHGETVGREVLGSGDGTAGQRFRVRRPHVTHLGAATGSGAQSTLEVRVDGVLWQEAATLEEAGPRDEWYLARRDDDGHTTVVFGDGVNGARVPTGAENVVAHYRTGIGAPGLVPAGSLTLLAVRPPGVRDVVNPLPSGGADDPEPRDAARDNAPLTVRTLGRVVAIADYEDFARGFGGIGKARATEVWHAGRRQVHLTVAGPRGAPIPAETLDHLRSALDDAREPGVAVGIAPFVAIYVRVRLDALLDPRLEPGPLLARVADAIRAALAFERRGFGEALTEAQLLAVAMGVDGVRDARLLALHPVLAGAGEPAAPRQDPILARLARWDAASGGVQPAELVLLEPAGATVTERGA